MTSYVQQLMIDTMRRNDIPLTRENYIELGWGDMEVGPEDDIPDFDELFTDFNPYHVKSGPDGGQFTSGEGGASGESKKKAGEKLDIKKDMSKAEVNEDDDQPTDDADELLAIAKKAEPVFRKEVEDIAKMTGGSAKFPSSGAVKGKERLVEKARLDYGGKVSEVKDVLRATIASDTVEGARRAAATFIARLGDNVLRVKDRIASVDRGYRDILINYKTENGIISEVQFNAVPMLEAKKGSGHDFYKKIRACVGCPEDEIRSMSDKMDAIYERAYDKAGDSKWLRS